MSNDFEETLQHSGSHRILGSFKPTAGDEKSGELIFVDAKHTLKPWVD